MRVDVAVSASMAGGAGERFQGGVIFYDGTHRLPMGTVAGKPVWAMPVAMMWER
ncbi:MAG: hypothetical protein HUU10_07010 [Bacteroidetes bacterium]|nr:hypothetical protein [Bacteroidota bacterium]